MIFYRSVFVIYTKVHLTESDWFQELLWGNWEIRNSGTDEIRGLAFKL